MKRQFVVSSVALLIGVVVLLAGCGIDRNHMMSPTAPLRPAVPESTEVCSWLRQSHLTGEAHDVSVEHPRATLVANVSVPCERDSLPGTLMIRNQAGSDGRCVFFLETLAGQAPYRRWYYRTATGDTLFVPNSANGSTSTFHVWSDAPAGLYNAVTLYKGTISMPAMVTRMIGPAGTQWLVTVSCDLEVFCKTCVKIPK